MHQRPDYVRVDHIPETKNKSLEESMLYNGNNTSINITPDPLLFFLDDGIGKLASKNKDAILMGL